MIAHLTGAGTISVLVLGVFVVASTKGGPTDGHFLRRSLSAKARELDEDICVPLLQPHILKVWEWQTIRLKSTYPQPYTARDFD